MLNAHPLRYPALVFPCPGLRTAVCSQLKVISRTLPSPGDRAGPSPGCPGSQAGLLLRDGRFGLSNRRRSSLSAVDESVRCETSPRGGNGAHCGGDLVTREKEPSFLLSHSPPAPLLAQLLGTCLWRFYSLPGTVLGLGGRAKKSQQWP